MKMPKWGPQGLPPSLTGTWVPWLPKGSYGMWVPLCKPDGDMFHTSREVALGTAGMRNLCSLADIFGAVS